jgi:Fe-S cluster assembly protein SufD
MTTSALTTLAAIRDAARAHVAETGFPTVKDEDWKYTSVAPIAAVRWRAAPLEAERSLTAGVAISRVRLVFVNGRLVSGLSRIDALPEGVLVESSASAPHLLEHLLAGDATGPTFPALNAAGFEGGAVVRVGPGVRVHDPIELLFLVVPGREATAAHPRNLVQLDVGASAYVIERHLARGPGLAFTNVVTDVRLASGARLEWDHLVDPGDERFHVGTLRVEQDRDSRFVARSFATSGRLVRSDISVHLGGPGGVCELSGLSLTRGTEHVDNHLAVTHASPACRSRQLYKGVLDGSSRTVFDGKVVVERDAAKTDARQTNRNLLLSDDATVDTKPNLRIFADDVKCAHGAAVGRLDEDALFYLRSRGIGEGGARALLTFAFASEVVNGISDDALRAAVQDRVARWLDHGPSVGRASRPPALAGGGGP